MPRSALPRVCVDLQSEEISRRIKALCAEGKFAECLDLGSAEQGEVVITDRAAAERVPQDAARPTAVVGIGTSDAVDAQLPLDFTSRELALALDLAARLTVARQERDAVARAQAHAQLLAETDPLTGLPNRRAWERRIAALRAGGEQPAWIALADLDNFKAINDRLGMTAADQVLARAARRIAGALRREDLVARIGGDEFGLLVLGADERQIRDILERVQAAVRAAGEVAVSIGYGRCRLDNLADAVKTAEIGLRKAKQSGGDCISTGD